MILGWTQMKEGFMSITDQLSEEASTIEQKTQILYIYMYLDIKITIGKMNYKAPGDEGTADMITAARPIGMQ
jgi:hypothetical protein